MYAIVDIETTGGHANSNGITEICIFLHDGTQIIDSYETLINPGIEIPNYIESFTGISNAMVAKSPRFEEVASKIFNYLDGCIFVAHNVNFDYSFVKYALANAGYTLNSNKLCTVRLGRKIIPGFPSYSLGNLCAYLNIPLTHRHRARGDAEATVKLFELLLAQDKEGHVDQMLRRTSKDQVLPPNLPKEQFNNLPSKPGVYYFHNQQGKIIYVGKANNLKKRVSSHFSNNSPHKQKQDFMSNIYAISYEETATELMALLLESHEIKHYWPAFNKAQKRYEPLYGLYDYEDRNGLIHLGFELITKYRQTMPLMEFASKLQAIETCRLLANEYELCLKICGLQDVCTKEICACKKLETASDYNTRVNNLINKLIAKRSFFVIDSGRNSEEYGVVWINKERQIGMGYVSNSIKPAYSEEVIPLLKRYKENFFMLNQVIDFANNNPEKIIWIE